MRIAFFTTRMMLGYGVDLTIHETARRLVAEHGHTVDVYTPTSDGTYAAENYGLREIIVHGGSANRALAVLELNAWRAMRRLRRGLAVAGAGYDVVVPCTHPYYCAPRALGVPGVFFNFGNVSTRGFTLKSRLNWRWLDFSERWLGKPQAEVVVSISRFLHDQQPPAFRQKGHVVYLGGDHYYPAPDGAREAFRARHGIPADAVVLGYCGRLHRGHPPYKGTGVLLELGRRITAELPDAVLVMCGIASPEDEEWVRAAGALPVANLPPAEMPAFYAALDVYVCASRWEGFNLPLVEAAWHGVPGVAYNAGAHGEHVTAVLVADGDMEQLTARARELAADAALRQRLGAQAREKAQRFSWDATAAELAAIMAEVAR